MRTQRGAVTNRRFQKNEGVSIYGKTTGMMGIGEPGTFVRLVVIKESGEMIFHKETITNLWGDYDFYFRTPGNDVNLIIKLFATYSISGRDETTIPIAVGNVVPKGLPSPEAEMAWLTIVPIILIGAGIIYAVKYLK